MRNLISSPKPTYPALRISAWVAAALAGILCCVPARATDPNRAVSQYVRDYWGTDRGFPRGAVYTITQTNDGYLWIGSEAGLVRFDGWNFQLVKDDAGSLTNTSVLGLAPDENGGLWIRLRNLSLLHYHNGVFETPPQNATREFAASTFSRDLRGRLLLYSTNEKSAVTIRNNSLEKVATTEDLPRSPIISLAQTSNSDVWLGMRGAGLFRLTGGQTLKIKQGLPDSKINCLLPDDRGGLWIGTDNGITRWNGTEVSMAGVPASLRGFQALTMTKDRDGNIWVGTDSRGLLRLAPKGNQWIAEGDDVSRSSIKGAINTVFEDREGNIWSGGADGIERLRDSAFVTYSLPEGLPTDGSNPVFVDSENRLWFPPVAGGLWWVKDGQHGRVSSEGLEQDVVYSIAGRAGELWIARQRGGLTQLRTATEPWNTRTYTERDGLAQNSVYSVYLARDGTVWAGTLSAGVSELKDGKFNNYTAPVRLASNTVVSILEGSDGIVWFATPSGLSARSEGGWHTYRAADGLPSENVNCLFEDSAGALWVGTASGLAFGGAKGFRIPANLPPMLREQILGIAEDKFGSLWISTSHHVLRVTRDALVRGAISEGDIRDFGLADGLRGSEGVKRQRSVIADESGRIWFSLNHGISMIDPVRLRARSAPPIVHVQTISTDGTAIATSGPVRVPGGRRRVTFGFSGLIFSIPERVRFRYTLEGFDHGWSDPTLTREAEYTNLAPASYRFRVMASSPDGIWSSSEASLAFVVEPLFWQTWWFRMAIALAAILVVIGLYRLRLRQATQRLNLRFEERLAERTRIAQELHDTLLQGFLSASMQVHLATDELPEESSARPALNRALQLMRQVIDEGRNAVQGLRSSAATSLDLEHAFSCIQQEFVPRDTQEDVKFQVIVEGERKLLQPALRDEVYRIGREALVNAFRHSHAENIQIELQYSSAFKVFVRDDGTGIDPHVLESGRERHWGLSGMRERADRIGAQLHVFSNTGGTEIELTVPGHIAFQGTMQRPSGSGGSATAGSGWLAKYNPLGRGNSAAASKNGRSK